MSGARLAALTTLEIALMIAVMGAVRLWGLVTMPLATAGMGWRAIRAERVLRAELRGFDDCARRVRWRFAPGVW